MWFTAQGGPGSVVICVGKQEQKEKKRGTHTRQHSHVFTQVESRLLRVTNTHDGRSVRQVTWQIQMGESCGVSTRDKSSGRLMREATTIDMFYCQLKITRAELVKTHEPDDTKM